MERLSLHITSSPHLSGRHRLPHRLALADFNTAARQACLLAVQPPLARCLSTLPHLSEQEAMSSPHACERFRKYHSDAQPVEDSSGTAAQSSCQLLHAWVSASSKALHAPPQLNPDASPRLSEPPVALHRSSPTGTGKTRPKMCQLTRSIATPTVVSAPAASATRVFRHPAYIPIAGRSRSSFQRSLWN